MPQECVTTDDGHMPVGCAEELSLLDSLYSLHLHELHTLLDPLGWWALRSVVTAVLFSVMHMSVRHHWPGSEQSIHHLILDSLFPSPLPPSAVRAAARLSRRSVAALEEKGTGNSQLFALLDGLIAIVLPLLLPASYVHPALRPLRGHASTALAALAGLRVVAPLSSGAQRMCFAAMSGSGAHGQYAPFILQSFLWFVWAMSFASTLGLDLPTLWSSLGMTGLLLGFTLQHYAADIAGGFTLAADARFSHGEQVTLAGPPPWTVIIDKIGLLSTKCNIFEFGQPCYVPNSQLVKSALTNDTRVRKRRVPLDVVVDPNTSAAKLVTLPELLMEGAFSGLRDAGLDEGVSVTNGEHGQTADIVTAMHPAGVHFELVLQVTIRDPKDLLRWKRVRTAGLLGMARALDKAGVKRGRALTVEGLFG